MMQSAILNFNKQFSYAPVIENKAQFKRRKKFIVLGMGGSHLAADILLSYYPALPLIIHSDYGLPGLPDKELEKTLIVASSYSGNTEEVIDGLKEALAKKLDVIVVAVSGSLIEMARQNNLAYIQLPDTGIQPRAALGYTLKAFLKIMNLKTALVEAKALKKTLKPRDYESAGKELAVALNGRIPVIYSSARNKSIAYNWKIKLNETGKIPAFYNVLPELNHNEMTGFDIADSSKHLSERFHFIFIKDTADNLRIQKRLAILEKLYRDRSLPVTVLTLQGDTKFEKIFSSLLLADWTAVHIARQYGLEAEQVPMVEEFKRSMK